MIRNTSAIWMAWLAAVGVGCGASEPPEPGGAMATATAGAQDRPPIPAGSEIVEFSDGRVTVRSSSLPRHAILERLAAQARFEIDGRADSEPLALEIERASLIEAIARILDGYAYSLAYRIDEASQNRVLARVEIGQLIARARANAAPRMRDRSSTAAGGRAEDARDLPSEIADALDDAEQRELLAKLDSPDPLERADAADWVELDREGIERVTALLETDPDSEVRVAIVNRLGDEDSPDARAGLILALRDSDPEVVLSAIEALEFQADAWLIPELEGLLSHPDETVRDAARDAIDYLK